MAEGLHLRGCAGSHLCNLPHTQLTAHHHTRHTQACTRRRVCARMQARQQQQQQQYNDACGVLRQESTWLCGRHKDTAHRSNVQVSDCMLQAHQGPIAVRLHAHNNLKVPSDFHTHAHTDTHRRHARPGLHADRRTQCSRCPPCRAAATHACAPAANCAPSADVMLIWVEPCMGRWGATRCANATAPMSCGRQERGKGVCMCVSVSESE